MHVLTTPVASVGHTRSRSLQRRLARMLMAEQMNRVVLRHADQREAKRKRDAVNRPEHRADSRHPATPALASGSAPSTTVSTAAIRDEQQHDQADAVDGADQCRFRLRAPLHQHGECARSAHRHAHIECRRVSPRNAFAARSTPSPVRPDRTPPPSSRRPEWRCRPCC